MTDLINDVPQERRERFVEIIEVTDRFCSKYLNPEYQDICRKMAAAICQADLPVERGKAEGWASGVVYAVGYVNFLTDPSSEPHMRAEEIAKGCGVSMATMQAKWKAIREELDVNRFDPDFGLISTLERNPFTWMAETKDGLLVDFRHTPREVQAEAFRQGLIPFAPGDSELSEKESSQQRELRSRYQHLRLVNKDLCQKLIGLLSKDVVLEAGERLRLREGDSLVCDPDEELPVLMDYAIFHMKWKGQTAYEHYLIDSPPDPNSDEMRCLEAMHTSIFSIFVIEEIQPGLGVVLRNLLSSETMEVVDIGLGSTAEPEIMLATRILIFDELNMTGGAPLVVNPPEKNPDRWLKRLLKLDAPKGGGFSDPAPVIRRCLFPEDGER